MATSSASGDGWFKIWEDGYDEEKKTWCVDRLIANKGLLSVDLPTGLPAGYYLVRPEVLALHNADKGDPQFYAGCAQVHIEDGPSGPLHIPAEFEVSIPGYVDAKTPGVNFSIYKKPMAKYEVPGPRVFIPSVGKASKAALTKEKQQLGNIPEDCLLKNANWCGKSIAAYSGEPGCWVGVNDCWAQSKECWKSAPASGGANCDVWDSYCTSMEDECNAGKFRGPPKFSAKEKLAPVPGAIPKPWGEDFPESDIETLSSVVARSVVASATPIPVGGGERQAPSVDFSEFKPSAPASSTPASSGPAFSTPAFSSPASSMDCNGGMEPTTSLSKHKATETPKAGTWPDKSKDKTMPDCDDTKDKKPKTVPIPGNDNNGQPGSKLPEFPSADRPGSKMPEDCQDGKPGSWPDKSKTDTPKTGLPTKEKNMNCDCSGSMLSMNWRENMMGKKDTGVDKSIPGGPDPTLDTDCGVPMDDTFPTEPCPKKDGWAGKDKDSGDSKTSTWPDKTKSDKDGSSRPSWPNVKDNKPVDRDWGKKPQSGGSTADKIKDDKSSWSKHGDGMEMVDCDMVEDKVKEPVASPKVDISPAPVGGDKADEDLDLPGDEIDEIDCSGGQPTPPPVDEPACGDTPADDKLAGGELGGETGADGTATETEDAPDGADAAPGAEDPKDAEDAEEEEF